MPELIVGTAALEAAVELCLASSRVAVDTESDSFYHYREKICLVQMTVKDTQGVQHDWIVDPLAPGFDPAPLRKLLAAEHVTKVFHDVGYDAILCRRHWGVTPKPVFDTMLGMRMLGAKQFGLGPVLKERFGVDLDKALQRSDWSLRPLTQAQLAYAANDTRYLLPLADAVEKDLKERGRWEWFREECERILSREAAEGKNEDERFWSTKGMKKLRGGTLSIARALFGLRERLASQWDRPPFRVFSNEVLFALSEQPPSDMHALGRTKGIGPKVLHSAGREILQLVGAPPLFELPPRVSRTAEEVQAMQAVEERFQQLRERRKQAAAELALDPEVIISNATLWELAAAPQPDVASHPDFQGWRAPLVERFIRPFDGAKKQG